MPFDALFSNTPQPHPDLTPEEVIGIQLSALQNNDVPMPDRGIEIAFRFASPENQVVTGPLENFIKLVHNPAYMALLGFQSVERGPLREIEDLAQQRVTILRRDGETVTYRFVLTKQYEGPFANCWMTDSVVRE